MSNVARRWVVVTTLVWGLIAGCAGGEELAPVGECESNLDCGANEVCDLSTNTCEPLRTENNTPNGTTPTNIGPGDTGFNPGNNSDTDAGNADSGMEVCEPACAADQVCMNGNCVSACPDGCPNDQVCTADGCVYPDCTAVGDPCNPDNGNQGDFLCLQDSDGNGQCYSSCDENVAASTCPAGEYCFDVSDDGAFKACFPSTCSSSADCDSGTCIDFDNEFATCASAGPIPLGGACNLNMGDNCVGGAFCRQTDSATGAGVCSAICDPWASTSNCPAGQACGVFLTWRTGLCTDQLDAQGTGPYEPCATPGNTCSDATRCLSVEPTTNGCFPYCRPDSNDCIGILPDGTDAICNNFVFNQNRAIGLCVSPCAADGDCGADGRCVNSACRATCTMATIADDCCGGDMPCEAQCVNGLCE
jgi:hypothetical protein